MDKYIIHNVNANWTLQRIWVVRGAVIGILYSPSYGVFYTLENSSKIIPEGFYQVKLTYSPKFSKKDTYKEFNGVPQIMDVKGRSGIRIHIGNSIADVVGCIAIGMDYQVGNNLITNSRTAYRRFMTFLKQKGLNDFWLDIIDSTYTTII